MSIEATTRPDNNLLAALRSEDFDLIRPYLTRETHVEDDVLYRPGEDVTHVYFPLGASLVSYLVVNLDGQNVQTVFVGREGGVGGIVSSGNLPAYCLITVKEGGLFLRAEVTRIQQCKDQSPSFRRMFERYADCLLAQMFQATACNAIHTIEQRAAKWILEEVDRTGKSTVHLSHDDLASMMGVGRSYTTRVLQKFKADQILATGRGSVTVTDKDALIEKSCHCNETVRSHFGKVLKGIYPGAE